MKTLFYPEHDRLEITDRPLPEIGADEVLVKVKACGICGSELETFKSRSQRRMPPLIMGHEFCGEIIAVGDNVSDWKSGMLAVSNALVSCGVCQHCITGRTNLCPNRTVFGMERSGAFAEYVNVPAGCLIAMPATADAREACLSEPLANGVHMVHLTRHLPLENVMIIGAGPIGLMTQQAFQLLRGVRTTVVDLRDERLVVASRLGATHVVNPTTNGLLAETQRLTGSKPFDLVVDAVGAATTSYDALKGLCPGGTLLIVGLYENNKSIWSYDLVLGEKQVMGSYAATQADLREALDLIASGQADVSSWVNYYRLEDGIDAFFNMMKAERAHIKSVLFMD